MLEWARGKRMKVQVQEGINAVAFTALASMSMYLIFGDIFNGPASLDKLMLESGSIPTELIKNKP